MATITLMFLTTILIVVIRYLLFAILLYFTFKQFDKLLKKYKDRKKW